MKRHLYRLNVTSWLAGANDGGQSIRSRLLVSETSDEGRCDYSDRDTGDDAQHSNRPRLANGGGA